LGGGAPGSSQLLPLSEVEYKCKSKETLSYPKEETPELIPGFRLSGVQSGQLVITRKKYGRRKEGIHPPLDRTVHQGGQSSLGGALERRGARTRRRDKNGMRKYNFIGASKGDNSKLRGLEGEAREMREENFNMHEEKSRRFEGKCTEGKGESKKNTRRKTCRGQ